MAKKVYGILGATGQIGHVIVENLLQKGHHVKAIGRDTHKLNFLKTKGAESIAIESFEKEPLLVEAFADCEAVFGMLPPGQGADNFEAYQDKVGEAITSALQKNSIRYHVNLSSLGAHLPEGTGPIKGLHAQEKRLNALKELNVIHLRPAYFMENFFWSIPILLQTGTLKSPLNPELSLPIVSTVDIGNKAADFLNQLNFKGQTIFEFVGPRALTLLEITKIIGREIGKPDLKYSQPSYEEIKKGMLTSGMPSALVDLMLEMYRAFNANKCQPTQPITDEHKGKITFEQFAKVFAGAYKHEAEQKAPV